MIHIRLVHGKDDPTPEDERIVKEFESLVNAGKGILKCSAPHEGDPDFINVEVWVTGERSPRYLNRTVCRVEVGLGVGTE